MSLINLLLSFDKNACVSISYSVSIFPVSVRHREHLDCDCLVFSGVSLPSTLCGDRSEDLTVKVF